MPGCAEKLTNNDRDVQMLRPGITGTATLEYRLEDKVIVEWVYSIVKDIQKSRTRPRVFVE